MKETRNGVNLLNLLRCPICKDSNFQNYDEKLKCIKCNEIYGYKNNIPVIIDKKYSVDIANNIYNKTAWEDYDVSGETVKVAKYSTVKKSIYQLITPSYRVQLSPTFEEFIKNNNITGNILELGGGPNSLKHPGVINCDINNYPKVDIIGDAKKLPFKDSIFDAIISNSVLEHIFDINSVVHECHRVLKNGGLIYICVPQVCGRHHTVDYLRWTLPGLVKQFEKFKIIDKGVCLGPGMFITHLATSIFNSLTPFTFLNAFICFFLEWFLFPFRFIDLIGAGNKDHENYAHTIFIVGSKDS